MAEPEEAGTRGRLGLHFAGATLSKVCPPVVQLVLLVVMGREGTLEDVGLLALASAISFNCGAIAEAGFTTSLSTPEAYYGERLPPLRATRGARLLAAGGGAVIYGLLWAIGLGEHEEALLVLLPLPALLGLTHGYAGVMNATGRLRLEGRITIAESLLVLALVPVLLAVAAPLPALLLALLGGRGAGTLARAVAVRRMPQSSTDAVPRLGRVQAWFLATSGSTVLHGQIDALVLGFYGSFALLGLYAPLVRTAYAGLLVAEGLAWALYGRVAHGRATEARERPQGSLGERLLGRWRTVGLVLGAGCAAGFWFLGPPVLELVVDADVDGLRLPVTLLALAVLVRFTAFTFAVDIIRSGRQRARLPVELAAAAVLGAVALVAAVESSLWLLALGKLAGEVVMLLGYARIARSVRGVPPRGEETVHA